MTSVNTLARETIRLPVDGAPGHVAKGAAAYLAILTYPDKAKARDHLIVAFESAVFRELVPPEHWKKLPRYLRRMAPDRIEGVIADALRLINGQRLHAARALQQLIMAAWPGGSVQAFGVGVSDLFDAITAMNESQRQLYRTGYIERANTKKIWTQSRAVVHLAMAVLLMMQDKDELFSGDILELILKPAWLPGAVHDAETLRSNLSALRANIFPAETIQVLPDLS